MTPAPLPADEDRRLAVLRELAILDAPPDERLDVVTAFCQSRFGVAIALVSLVDEGRQWFASRQGMEARETSREVSFCAHAVAAGSALVVPDALCDPRFADNPLVTGAPGIRFYAGAPVRVRGATLGTVCLIDTRPRHGGWDLLAELQDIADAVAWFLEERTGESLPGTGVLVRTDAAATAPEVAADPWIRLVQFCRTHPASPDAARLKEIALGLQSRRVPRLVLLAQARRLAPEAGAIAQSILARVA
jgi:GAF domain-containing protein